MTKDSIKNALATVDEIKRSLNIVEQVASLVKRIDEHHQLSEAALTRQAEEIVEVSNNISHITPGLVREFDGQFGIYEVIWDFFQLVLYRYRETYELPGTEKVLHVVESDYHDFRATFG